MTPEDEAAIRARLEAATEGPWTAESSEGDVWAPGDRERICRTSSYAYHCDAEFIAHARTDVERLLTALDEARAERDKAQRAAKTLGGIVEKNARMILDITGLHDWVDEDGDGDWGAVWENAYELRPRANAAEAQVERLHFDLDREARARQAAESALAAVEQAADPERMPTGVQAFATFADRMEVSRYIRAALATPTTTEESNQAGHHLLAAECRRDNCAEVHYARKLPDPTTPEETQP